MANTIITLLMTVLCVIVYVKADECDLNCSTGYRCAMTRSTCDYAPCPYFPTCVEITSTEDQIRHLNTIQRHPSHGSHLASILSNEGVNLPHMMGIIGSTRPGQCPAPTGLGPCINACRSDGDCPTSQKCCNNGCGNTCRDIVSDVIEKPGTCPRRFESLVTTCQEDCTTDLDCPGVQKCCHTSCAAVCSDPCYYWIAPNQRSNRKNIIWKLPFFCRL